MRYTPHGVHTMMGVLWPLFLKLSFFPNKVLNTVPPATKLIGRHKLWIPSRWPWDLSSPRSQAAPKSAHALVNAGRARQHTDEHQARETAAWLLHLVLSRHMSLGESLALLSWHGPCQGWQSLFCPTPGTMCWVRGVPPAFPGSATLDSMG